MNRQVLTVSAVNRYIKGLISSDYVLRNIYVRGEVSNCKYNPSGHIYFTLKDSGGTISCVMFAGSRGGLDFDMREGMSVVVLGYVGVYERSGSYQLYAKEIFRDGVGALYEAYDALKKKLQAEGLFDESHKKKIPAYPKTLGVATARTGAAVHDIITVSLRRDPWIQIVFCPCRVQGDGAAESVCEAVKALDRYGVDVIIAGRGGGSIEDLMAFNEEKTARAVYECETPVISAVGHETDTTIMDYAADLRAPTPSAAAELAVPDMRQVIRNVRYYYDTLCANMDKHVKDARDRLHVYHMSVKHLSPEQKASDDRLRLLKISEKMQMIMERSLETSRNSLALRTQELEGLSPLRQLERGYAYVSDSGEHGISSVTQAETGMLINIAVTDGDIHAQVTGTASKIRAYGDLQGISEVDHGEGQEP